ncbi:MAG TPA: MFS transporter [Acidimicrobiales bacterium]|nr:MFS transporter [Acidimicrobiales bacterium]
MASHEGPRLIPAVGRAARRGARSAKRKLVPVLGGRTRTRVIVVLACVLALSSADTATVGSAAIELRRSLHISTFDIGLLVTVTAVVGAVFSLPFGALADRLRRTWLLGSAIVFWGLAMIWSATAGSFGELLGSRLALGGVTAVAGPVVASLVGDWFPGSERGQIYSYILTGELLGAGLGFAFTGEIAALSWRLAFVILAIPAFVVSWAVFQLPEPLRGGRGALAPEPGTRPWLAAQRTDADAQAQAQAQTQSAQAPPADDAAPEQRTDAQRLAIERGIRPDPVLVARADPRMGFFTAVRYVLSVRTNVVLIISGALGYYFLAGVQTFGVEFVSGKHGNGGQYHVTKFFANGLLIVVGVGAVVGVLVAGPLGDMLLRRGYLAGRVRVAAVAATVTVVMMIPALATHSVLTALPYLMLAGVGLAAQNPPIDAARLDIMPSWLWGRAEGVRTFVRTGAQALAPLIFGAVSDYIFGGGAQGLRWTFVVMLVPFALSAFYLFVAARRYPRDVATAAAAPPAPAAVLAGRVPPGPPSPALGRTPAPSTSPPGTPRPDGSGTRWIGGSGPRTAR